MRARESDIEGYAEHDGTKIFYEVFGEGDVTLLLIPGWQLGYSRSWKAQIPYLARHYRVVAMDLPGNGRSDRPPEPSSYSVENHLAWSLAVLDASGTERAIPIGISAGAIDCVLLAALAPHRVEAIVPIGSSVPLSDPWPEWRARWSEEVEGSEGWQKVNRRYMREDFGGFAEFFVGQIFS